MRDAGDEFVAELAVAARADAILTYNVRDFKGIEKFGIEVVTPKDFLVAIGEAR